MSNVFDYLTWRGDIPFESVGLNNIDALIFSRLSYIPFDGIVSDSLARSVSLAEASAKFMLSVNLDKVYWKADPELLKFVGKTDRFGNIRVSAYMSELDYNSKMQFAALVFHISDDLHYISFRGTDNSFIGWREDFNMYSMTTLPSQQKALEYLNTVASFYKGNLILGGHSKGGNLAVYASAFCSDEIKRRIVSVYNHDGPGFKQEIFEAINYGRINDKIKTFVPQSSVFGMMLEHDDDFSVVKSTNKSFMQHDIYSWQLIGSDFEYLEERTNSSYFIDHTLSTLFEKMTTEQIDAFAEAFFTVVESCDTDNFDDVQRRWFSSTTSMLRGFKNLDKKSRSNVFKTLKKAIGSLKSNFSDINPIKRKDKQ